MRRIINRPRLVLALFACIVFFITVWTTLTFYQHRTSAKTSDFPPSEVLGVVSAAEPSIPDNLSTLTILLLGYGGAGHQGGLLSDVIQLIHINFEDKYISAISIPRDIWVELPNGTAGKINGAFSIGGSGSESTASGGEIAIAMAEVVTGLDIQYYAAVDFVGFERLIGETLDGIEVTVTEPFEDPWYPIRGKELEPCGYTPEEIADITNTFSGFELEKQFPCRYEHLSFPPGKTSMEGGDALKYVRSRHGSSGGDFSRSRRQHDLLLAVRDKLFSLEVIQNIPEFFQKITKQVSTNMSLEIAQYVAPALRTSDTFTTQGIVLSTENVLQNGKSNSGQYILLPKQGANDWSGVHSFVKENLHTNQ